MYIWSEWSIPSSKCSYNVLTVTSRVLSHRELYHKLSRHKEGFRLAGHCAGSPLFTCELPSYHKISLMWRFGVLFCIHIRAVEQTVQFMVNWNAWTPMWCHCNAYIVTVYFFLDNVPIKMIILRCWNRAVQLNVNVIHVIFDKRSALMRVVIGPCEVW